jgi:hypothetical protein
MNDGNAVFTFPEIVLCPGLVTFAWNGSAIGMAGTIPTSAKLLR